MSEPTIRCEEVLRKVFAYLDGELETREQQQVDSHLLLCRSCFSRAEFERRLKAHLGELRERAIEPELEQRIRSLIR